MMIWGLTRDFAEQNGKNFFCDVARSLEWQGKHKPAPGVETVEGSREFEGRAVAEVAVVEFAVVAYGGDDTSSPRVVEAQACADFVGVANEDLECGVGGKSGRSRTRRSRSRSLRFATG